MEPGLRDGDVVRVARVEPGRIAVGDVVCYESGPGRLTLHRVIDRADGHVVTRGDALGWVEYVRAERILGKVTVVEPRGRLERIVTRLVGLARRLGRTGHVEHA
jgi:signal peptidase I